MMVHRRFCFGQQQTLQRLLFKNATTKTTSPLRPVNIHSRRGRQHHCRRVFSSFDNNEANSKKKNDPFAILGIPPSSSYDHVKRAFVRLALETHPDRVGKGTSNISSSNDSISKSAVSGSAVKSSSATAEFIQIRQAFEAIHHLRRGTKSTDKDYDTGSANDKNAADDYWPDGDEWWMHDDHGGIVSHLFTSLKMSHETRQEVIHAYNTMGPPRGGNLVDKGGYWEMARQMAERQEAWQKRAAGRNGNDNSDKGDDDSLYDGPILRLEASSSQTGSTRRRRKR